MTSQIIETRTGRYWLDDQGIFHGIALGNPEGTLAEAQENLAAFKALLGDRKYPMLVEIGSMNKASRDAREFIARESPKYISAVAAVFRSPVSRILGSFFLGLNKPAIPVRLFDNEAAALEWLKGYL